MTNEEILKKAIEKAYEDFALQEQHSREEYVKGQIERDEGYRIIFSHDFAKKFWGEEWVETEKGRTFEEYWKEEREELKAMGITNKGEAEYDFDTSDNLQLAWCYHLQQIALEKDKFKYLEKFL